MCIRILSAISVQQGGEEFICILRVSMRVSGMSAIVGVDLSQSLGPFYPSLVETAKEHNGSEAFSSSTDRTSLESCKIVDQVFPAPPEEKKRRCNQFLSISWA